MRIWKRLSAFLCALVLILDLTLFPVRIRATAGALAAVGAAVTVSAFLMASGIYPYISEDGQSIGEWGAESLYDLWTQYVDSFEGGQLPSGGTVETFNEIKSFVVGGALAIASGTWQTLREFASWIVSNFSVTDNQSGLFLGRVSAQYYQLPSFSASPPANILRDEGLLALSSYYISNLSQPLSDDVYRPSIFASVGSFFSPAQLAVFYWDENRDSVGVVSVVPLSSSSDSVGHIECFIPGYSSQQIRGFMHRNISYDGVTYYYASTRLVDDISLSRDIALSKQFHYYCSTSLYVFDTQDEAVMTILGLSSPEGSNNSGVTADTTTVAPLDALPANKAWGGLAVEGTSNPVGAVEQGITEREKPVVRPVEVEIGAGTDVDSETGEVTQNPVVITPEDVVPTVAALSPPASFFSALQVAVTTKFPFCLPFDLFKILQAFYVPPEAPVFSLSFHDPFSNGDFSITVDLSPWDEVAAVVRTFEAMILLSGFCLNFDKFNVIHLILGGLG